MKAVTRSPPVWFYALAVSLLLHAVLVLVLLDGKASAPEAPDPLPIEARLIRVPPPAAPSARPRRVPRPETPVAALDPAAESDTGAPEAVVAEAVEPPAESGDGDVAGEEVRAAPPQLNALPPRIDMRFQVRYGIVSGEQTLVWASDGERYTVTGVVSATGLAGLFYSGRFVQTSFGRVTPQGLVPDMFWDQRGDRRSTARFDAATGVLTYNPAQGAPHHMPYQGDALDSLSLFFHLALTAPPEDRSGYQVFNGRRLRHYAYETRGETVLETALGPLRTLHLVRAGHADGRFELWLAIDRHYLPVRVLRTDDKGNEVELSVASISP